MEGRCGTAAACKVYTLDPPLAYPASLGLSESATLHPCGSAANDPPLQCVSSDETRVQEAAMSAARRILLPVLTLPLLAATARAPGAHSRPPAFVVREYRLPRPNAFPHDPAVARDGLWLALSGTQRLGRIDLH